MSAILRKRLNTDDRLLLTGLATVNLSTGAPSYLTGSATVTATVLDHATQAAVTGDTFPIILTYITGSSGDFHGVIRESLAVDEFQRIDIRVVIDNGTDQKRTLVLPCIVVADLGD